MIFIIEHMEDELYEWCLLEYRHMSSVVGKDNLWFTNVKTDADKLKGLGKVMPESVATMGLKRCCLLDLNAPSTLAPADGKSFDHLIFGGILGDNPPRGRTKALRVALEKAGAVQIRDLGTVQMSTDTAVLVAKTIVDGTPLAKIPFSDTIVIETGEGEEVELPYRYVLGKDDKPILPMGLIELLSRDDIF